MKKYHGVSLGYDFIPRPLRCERCGAPVEHAESLGLESNTRDINLCDYTCLALWAIGHLTPEMRVKFANEYVAAVQAARKGD